MQAAEYIAGQQAFLWRQDWKRLDKRSRQQQQTVLLKAFLPEGYPDSVTSDYASADSLVTRS